MRKHLIVLAFMMLLMPIMHACSDDGSGDGGGNGDGSFKVGEFLSLDKSEINLGTVEAEQVQIEVTIKNITNTNVEFYHGVTNVASNGGSNCPSLAPARPAYQLKPGESCIANPVLYLPFRNSPDFHVGVEDSNGEIVIEVSIPIKYTTKVPN